MTIFSDQYVLDEIDFMEFPEEPVEVGEAMFYWKELPSGRIDDYLNVNYRAEPLRIPSYRLSDGLWMSITPMEVQSAHVAIARASYHGTVGMGGLGMGYTALRMAQTDVEYIDVYEQNQDCIDLFNKMHGQREECEKINIIHGDVREEMLGKQYDFVFMDIYKHLLEDSVLADIELFLVENDIGEYRYWGQELNLHTLALENHLDEEMMEDLSMYGLLTFDDKMFYSMFFEYEGSNLRPPCIDSDFSYQCMNAHTENCRESARRLNASRMKVVS